MTSIAPTPESPQELVARIERELILLWKPDDFAAPKTRACTMNLIVAAPPELAERYTPIIEEVTKNIPARAILLALDEQKKRDELRGDVTAVCGVGGENAICSEQVRLYASGMLRTRVPSVVDTLSVPELPTTLVWLGRVREDDPVFLGLAGVAQRVILDTEYTSLASLVNLAHWSRGGSTRPKVADLTWTRLGIWHEMCARFFDDPQLREHATHITRFVMTQASEPGTRIGPEGGLLLGWIATRLGWKATVSNGKLRIRRPDEVDVAIELHSVVRPPKVAPLALASVAIEAEHSGISAKGTIGRELASGLTADAADADVLVWKLEVSIPSAQEQRVRMRANKGARLLEQTLHRSPHDPALAEAAAFAEQIPEDSLVCV